MKKIIIMFVLLSVFAGSTAAQVVINYRRPGSAYVFGGTTLSSAKADKIRFPGSWGPMAGIGMNLPFTETFGMDMYSKFYRKSFFREGDSFQWYAWDIISIGLQWFPFKKFLYITGGMDIIGFDFPIKRTLPDGTVEKVPFGLPDEPGSFPLSMGFYAELGISPHFWWVMDHVQFYARASRTVLFSPLDDKYSNANGLSKKLRTVSYEFGIRIPFWFIRD